MKIVINSCFGGFSLSPKAIKKLAELNGKECYFFSQSLSHIETTCFEEINEEEALKSFSYSAFSVKNPNELLGEERLGSDGTYKEYNKKYDKISLDSRPADRTDKNLIKVVEELGEEASGKFAKLKVIKIPDGIKWVIDEYDGRESVEEEHRSWN